MILRDSRSPRGRDLGPARWLQPSLIKPVFGSEGTGDGKYNAVYCSKRCMKREGKRRAAAKRKEALVGRQLAA